MQVCIIGAGMAGLCCTRHVVEHNMIPTVFEQNDQIGGTWVYTDQVGTDKYGNNIHTSMYEGLRTNLPKEVMGYPDFPVGNQEESYVQSEDILEFLKNYEYHYKLEKYIKFLHQVVQIVPSGERWQVMVRDLKTNQLQNYSFDFIMVCNGHYHTPINPKFMGLDLFKGMKLHSHDYRNAGQFKDKTVLVIGAGPSGMDICNEVSKEAAKVVLSHHLKPQPETKFRDNVLQKPDVTKFCEYGAFFTDATFDEFNAVIFCTGYKYSFPFLSVDCGITVDNNYVQPLYKHCININYPSMAFIGIPFYVCAAQMMDLQVRFVLRYFNKEKLLPTREQMLQDMNDEMNTRWQQGYLKRHAHMMGPSQMQYYDDLAKTAGIKGIPPVMTKLHNESSDRFLEDLLHYRNEVFRIIDDECFVKL